ncbi:MAG: hypothetical protein HZC02_04955 [Candidatus Levybacteria bacterium]|nr:hypothetical protein [Candidatus Levybacteria bacterium]
MKKLSIASLSGAASAVLVATQAFAENVGTSIRLCPSANGAGCATLQSDPGVIVGNVLNFLFIVAAVVSVVFLIWGGIKWITAGGDKTKVQTARETIIGAIIGLVIAFAAFFIVNFVLKLLFGQNTDLNNFNLPAIFK